MGFVGRKSANRVAHLSVVLPTYNEADNVAAMIPALRKEFGEKVEILVIDDDSPDGTSRIAESAGAKVIVRKNERGLAGAVMRGLKEAAGDWILIMDCDFQHPVEAAGRMWARAQQGSVDMVIGSRFTEGGDASTMPMSRRVISGGARLMAQVAVRPVSVHKVSDSMSGFFAVRKEVLEGVELRPIGYKIGLEIIARAPLRAIAEIGYQFGDRGAGESKLGSAVIAQYFLHALRLGFSKAGYLWVYAAVFITVAIVVAIGTR